MTLAMAERSAPTPAPRRALALVPSDRPKTRGECEGGPRPCPFVSCRYNLYLEVHASGALRTAHPAREPWQVPAGESCALDLADQGPQRRDTIARLLGLVPERVRQVQNAAIGALLEEHGEGLRTLFDLGEPSRSTPLADRLEALADTAPARAICRPQDREARREERLRAWTSDVLALLRAGVPLPEAWARANAGGEP